MEKNELKNRSIFSRMNSDYDEKVDAAIKANDMVGVQIAYEMKKPMMEYREQELACIYKKKEIDEKIKKIVSMLEKKKVIKKLRNKKKTFLKVLNIRIR